MSRINLKLVIAIMLAFIFIINFSCMVFAATEQVIDKKTESTLVELKEKEMKSLQDYEETYGSKSYGMTAYILHKVQIFSIPFTILGILIAAVYDYIIGVRHLETKEKGQALMIMFVTLGIICQVLPLVFTIVVKFGRE